MVEMKALLCSESENMRKLADMLTKNGVSVKVCPAEPLDILQECMTQPPFAVLIEEAAFEYRELVRKISAQSAITKVYILCDPFTPYFDIHSECKDIYYIDNMYKHADILAKLKYSAVDIVKKDYISRETLYQTADNIVHTALNELCFTANYTGSAYLQSSLVALCLSDLKHSDSMCKTIFPYIADQFDVSTASVERSIRTVIMRCWNNSSDEAHVKYFGFIYSKDRGVPTNREFIMILADSLIREMQRMTSAYKVNSMSAI